MMLINIWATILHYGEKEFISTDNPKEANLSLLIREALEESTVDISTRPGGESQIWAINPLYIQGATAGRLLEESYIHMRDSNESYLALFTPGFSDIIANTSPALYKRELKQFCRQSRAFNKRVIALLLGTPVGCSEDEIKRIGEINIVTNDIIKDYDGEVVDLRDIEYTLWNDRGSRPKDLLILTDHIVVSILNAHPGNNRWQSLER